MELGTPPDVEEVGVETLPAPGICIPLRASSEGVEASVVDEAMLLAEFREGADKGPGPVILPSPPFIEATADARGVETLFVPFGRGNERPIC